MTTINPRAIFGTHTTDFSKAVLLPKPQLTKITDLPAERQSQLKQSLAEVENAFAAIRETQKRTQELEKGYESNEFSPRSITLLDREETLHQIGYVSELIQSGQSENYSLSTSYNGRITTDFRQYVYWLQQHAKSLEGSDAPSTLAQV
ncbi:hypothetical protein FNB15_13480 [Ferrovibrio terrae]|uniref:Uncharacterized protein n=1 Tax=Ferrovibrio terrae TaxID=2594003 RepID=A0A516H356_9PROT|nr:hypothetical protein [Ferrovibrio terrae]QDO98218.1 hypothetical protein FNB15_13480 [Ferrovibrio terrae]